MVVNLYYTNPDLIPVEGFGYLIPRSIPWEQNPERALGVIFDSALAKERSNKGTKVTVMLGGHWWDDFTSYPDEAEGAAMAKAVLKRHLKIEDEPDAVLVGLQRECIPQYTVGHDKRMAEAHHQLKAFNGKLSVAGNSYTGVGLNDCIRAARDVAFEISRTGRTNGVTGLEQFLDKKYVLVNNLV
jgi:oxygen-dependent protoporphyrinogen oxidase